MPSAAPSLRYADVPGLQIYVGSLTLSLSLSLSLCARVLSLSVDGARAVLTG
jgi:hypothetical protein